MYRAKDVVEGARRLPADDTNQDQRKILRRLGLERLADDGELAVALTPRSVFVTTTEDETA